jgi:hypothetical protein
MYRATQTLNRSGILAGSDINKLSRINGLFWLSAAEIKLLAGTLALAEFDRGQNDPSAKPSSRLKPTS